MTSCRSSLALAEDLHIHGLTNYRIRRLRLSRLLLVQEARHPSPRIIKTLGHETVQFYMNVQEQIKKYITSQSEAKRSDMQELHRLILQVLPACKLWFLDGKNSENKTVSNPNIGYGFHTIKYADGKTREFYQIGMSANKTGISVYILGINDKTYLAHTYGKKLGKATVSGYCIRFKTLT